MGIKMLQSVSVGIRLVQPATAGYLKSEERSEAQKWVLRMRVGE